MRKLFIGINGKYYGMAKTVETNGKDLIITMPGDFPGMLERNVVFKDGTVLYEDDDRIYIDYK